MQRNFVRQEYANFLRRLLYAIDHIDWSGNRPAQMAILLCHLEKNGSWPEEIKEDQEKAEKVIESFCKGEISEFELSKKIAELIS